MHSASVFLVEDEALIRLMLIEMLEEILGHRVVAEAGTVGEGKSLAEVEDFDFAVLDVSVGGSSILPVAETIQKRGLPVLFVGGYKRSEVPGAFRDSPFVEKPIQIAKLEAAVASVLTSDEGE